MSVLKKALLSACVTLSFAAVQPASMAASDSEVTKLFEQVKLDYQVFTLPNGLTALVYPDHSTPDVYVGVYYRVGSKDEPQGKTGFAHLYEHLMFQGTKNAPGEFISLMGSIGASGINGTTSIDRTNYFQVVPTGSLDTALWLESDRMAHILTGITQELLDEQRDVVKNEKREGDLRPGTQAYHSLIKHLYPVGHPYDHTTIGSMTDLDNATLDDVHQWYKDYYGATNAIVVLAGDVTIEDAKQKIAYYFSDVVPGKRIAKVEESVPVLTETKRVELYDKVAQTAVTRVWPLPSRSSKELVLLRYLSTALAGDQESPLNKRLQDKLKYVSDISFTINDAEVNSIAQLAYFIRDEAGVSKAEIDAIIDEELAKFFNEGPDPEILQQVFRASDAALIRAMKDKKGLAEHMVESLMFHEDPEFFRQARQWEMNSTPETLKQLTKKWLSRPYLEITVMPEPAAQAVEAVVDRVNIPMPVPTNANISFPELKKATLDNGIQLVVIENNELPAIDVSFEFNVGAKLDYNYSDGTADLAINLLTSATKRFDEYQLATKQKNIATAFSANSGQFISSLSFNALTPYLNDAIALAADVIMNPAYPEKGFRLAKEGIEIRHQQLQQDPTQAAGQLFKRAFWGETHPQGKIRSQAQELSAISREHVVDFHKNEMGPNVTTVYMVGDISLAQGKQLLNKHFANWKKVTPTPEKAIEKPQPMSGKVILVDNRGATSTSILAAHPIATYDAAKAETLQLMNGPFGGEFESRINLNLREDKAWSYGVSSTIQENPFYQQNFQIRTKVQTDKVAASVSELLKEIKGYIGDKPVTQQEIDLMKYMWSTTFPSRFNSDLAYLKSAINAELFGLPYNRAETYVERLGKISLEQVQQAAKNTIKPNELFWIIVGDVASYEKELRALNIGEVEVWDAYGNKIR